MKKIKWINLFFLTLFCQAVFSQNNDIIKSFNLRMDKSVEKGLDSTNISKALKVQFKIPENYEFKRQVIKGTKNRTSEKDDLGYTHERYTQYYRGIKIENSDVRVHYLNDMFVSANGEYIDVPDIDVSVILSKEDAIQKAKKHIGAKEYMWEDEKENNWLKNITNDKTASFYPNAEIVICKNSIDFQDTTFHVAYKIDIYAKEPLRHDYVYVDSKTGNILAVIPILINVNGTAQTRYSGTRTIATQQNGNVYRLRDYGRGGGIETYNLNRSTSISNAVDFTDNDNNWTAAEYHNTNKDDAALDAHWGAMMTFDYFKNIHGRNSYNNNNGVLKNYVHYNSNYDNAGWNGTYNYMIYGDGYTQFDALTALDVIAHEIGHGVCQYSAGLIYQGESGAINESFSDIWGACVENWATTNKQIWLIGEDISLQDAALRSMDNPKRFGDPDTYGGTNWINPSSGHDNGGVHINSGVMNYWFYLLSVGGSGTNDLGNSYSIAGISIDKAAKIAYRAESVYMTASTNFAAARTHTIQAATDLYGACSPEVVSTTNAWRAVGVGNLFTGTTTTIANVTYVSSATITACNLIVYNVKVQNGAKLILDAVNETTVNRDFEVALGSQLEIR
jgi:Zn-dependent metalloprotease